MSKTMNKYSPEMRERAVRMGLDNPGQHESRWSTARQGITVRDVPRGAILSISSKIGCAPQRLNAWVKKAGADR